MPINDNDQPFQFKKLKLVSAMSENPIKYLDVDQQSGSVSVDFVTEDDFIEFWCIDAWDALATALSIFRVDVSDIRTEEDEMDEARKSGARLYRIVTKHPKYLGWMASDEILDGSDLIICTLFFGGKIAALVKGWKKSRKSKKPTKNLAAVKSVKPAATADWSEPVCGELDNETEV